MTDYTYVNDKRTIDIAGNILGHDFIRETLRGRGGHTYLSWPK